MQVIESIPLSRTRQATPQATAKEPASTADDLAFPLADIDAMPLDPLPPMRIVTSKPPLPAELWLSGLSPLAALAKWRELAQAYFCSCGADAAGWFVRCNPQNYEVTNV